MEPSTTDEFLASELADARALYRLMRHDDQLLICLRGKLVCIPGWASCERSSWTWAAVCSLDYAMGRDSFMRGTATVTELVELTRFIAWALRDAETAKARTGLGPVVGPA